MKTRTTRITVLILLLSILATALTGCDDVFVYRGKYPDLYTVAAHSVLGLTKGDNVHILPMETDSYGRTLFACSSLSGLVGESRCLSVLIAQKTEEPYVYFIEDDNVLVKEIPIDSTLTMELVTVHYSDEELDLLKGANDWERPFRGKMLKKEIGYKIEDPYPEEIREKAFSRISAHYHISGDYFLTQDQDGRAIYFIREQKRYMAIDAMFGKGFLMMVLPDGTVSALEQVTDLLNYQKQLIAFKVANGWNNG